MADFNEAVEQVLKNEGGYSNNKNDRGGQTNFGISQKFLDSVIYYNADHKRISDVKNITRQDAINICEEYFWQPIQLYAINDQQVATKILDMCFNLGHRNATKLVQRACLRVASNCGVYVDGIFGAYTLNTINAISDSAKLLNAIRGELAAYYQQIINNDVSQDVFKNGWMRRAYA